jgi:uncharacterized protein YndB with AHSA1/START domain
MHGPDGTDYPSDSVFLEVVRPERIVFRHVSEAHPYELVISLEEQGDGTRVTWRMIHESADLCARVRPFVVPGNEQNFDRLAAELERGDRERSR